MKKMILVSLIFLGLGLSACDVVMQPETDAIQASGIVEAVEFTASAQVSGEVQEIFSNEGDTVKSGDVLFVLENESLVSQHDQAEAALEAAQANLKMANSGHASAEAGLASAHIGLDLARIQYDLVLSGAQLQALPLREDAWNEDAPSAFELPVWYFEKSEKINAAQREVSLALETLEIEQENLKDILADVSNSDILAVEERLAQAQVAYEVAEELSDKDIETNERETISDYVQSLVDSAEAELESAQAEYDRILSEVAYDDLLESRARVIVAYERYQLSLAYYYELLIGDDSLEVTVAELGVKQAEAFVVQSEAAVAQAESAVEQAEKAVVQAEANLKLSGIQLEKLEITSKVDGVVLAKTIEVGELVQPGVGVMVVGELDDLKITVYIPEDQYGQVLLGDLADVQVDSYPDEVFSAVVTRIADQAEYTPRNVQTQEDRRTTVFAIELSLEDTQGKLKPGMPADVKFK